MDLRMIAAFKKVKEVSVLRCEKERHQHADTEGVNTKPMEHVIG